MDRTEIVHQTFMSRVAQTDLPQITGPNLAAAGLSQTDFVELFRVQVLSRHLDRVSRKLQAKGQSFYTIGSSGHEANAGIAWACRADDMAFLHYRDAAFQLARARQVTGETSLWDILLSFTASSEDPISGGRHKVLGSKRLAIPPQTSTIASHLPKAVGAAYSIGLAKRLPSAERPLKDDSLIVCSFGDASLNHSTAQGAINTAGWTSYQHTPLPILFVCEDNGIGISTRTPNGWVAASMQNRPGIKYFAADGIDIISTYAAATEAVNYVRIRRKPAFLHMSCVRLYGHAGADTATSYMSKEDVEADEARDPLLATASSLIHHEIMTSAEILTVYRDIEARVERVAEHAITRPRLSTSSEVMADIVPPQRAVTLTVPAQASQRESTFGPSDLRAMGQPQHLAKIINFTLTDLMLTQPDIVLAGEDVGRKGGVYGITQRLYKRFGRTRVIDTLLDEQSILGLGIGLAHNNILAIPEIQFLAYLHNAEDQIRGEAATLPFFSNGQYTNPMVIRVAGLGYQRGFGGHFHNDNSVAVLRDIPGIILACPSNGHDAALMLREAVRLAKEEQRVVIFLEPIALYMTKDLHEAGDGGWTHAYPTPDTKTISTDSVGQHGDGTDIAIVSYANGYFLSRQATPEIEKNLSIKSRTIDLRWLSPIPEEALLSAIAPCSHVLIVDECRRSGSPSEALMTLLAERTEKKVSRLTADDCFIATGPSFGATLPSRELIIDAATTLWMGQSIHARAAE